MPSRPDRLAGHPAVLAAAWLVAVGVVAALVDHFWIPLDDGTLAQSAERVLAGQLPHRDFGDPYTGLNALLGALAFRLFGVELVSLRIPLVAGFALWLPAVWRVARRFARPTPALAATALAAVLSVLAYPAAMPTWFGLFLTTWGLLFLLRFLEGGERGWLVATGVAAGVSVLFKVTGLYFVAAALLTLVWHRAEERGRPEPAAGAADPGGRTHGFSTWGIPVYPAFAGAGVLVFLLLLAGMVLPRSGAAGSVHFLLPGATLGLAVVARSWQRAARPHHPVAEGFLGTRIPALLADGVALGAGLVLPVSLFLIPYALSGSVPLWVEGVFLLPGERFQFAASGAGAPWTVLPGLAGVGFLAASGRIRGADRPRLAVALAAAFLAAVALDDRVDGAVFATLWYGARSWTPWLVLWGVAAALRPGTPGDPVRRAPLFAVVAAAGLWALVQFPYVSPAYFFYVAPLAVLATLAVAAATRVGHGPVLGVFAGLFLLLGLGYVGGVVASADTPLPGERAGILVSAQDARVYGALVDTVAAHRSGGTLWAGPDAPEVYFLTGAANPTPVLYEFLGAPGADDPGTVPVGTEVAVVHTRPLFSPAPRGLEEELRERLGLDARAVVGPFVVLWRTPPSPGAP